MTMRAVLERNGTATSNVYGHPEAPVFANLATVPCWVWSKDRREVNDTKKFAMEEQIKCGMPLDTDVTELDQVTQIENRLGVVLYSGPLRIDTIQYKHTHIEMNLRRIQSQS